ncbi:flippase [Halobacterium salinarum]|uniref:flippase n=1 Tax=Halobacterium salinarum TaxID=2242 RepID=UPI001F43E6E5|nr:flippase [Halobacterium salinarum]MCF2206133.1 flippase [Halobacterium salinarum]MCF2240162.1 flippase [Halobacterium salinarum]
MRDSITKLVSISFLGGLIGRALRYGFNIIIARGLGVEALGVFAFGMVLMKGGGVFVRIGLDSAARKFIPVYRNDNDPARVTGTIVLCLVTPAVVGAVIAMAFYWSQDVVETVLGTTFHATTPLFVLGIPLVAVMMVGVSVTYGLKETKYSVYIRDFGQSVTGLVFMAVAAFVLSDLTLLVVGYLLSIAVGISLAVVYLWRENAIRLDVSPVFEYRKIFAFSLPLTLVASIQYLVSWTDILVLQAYLPSEPVGWYQASYQTSVLLVVVLQSANSIFPPIASELHDSGNHGRLNRVYTAVTKWITYLTVLGLAFVVVYRSQILSIFGTTVRPAQTSLVVLAVAQTIAAVIGPTGYLLMMTGHERLQLINSSIAAALNLALNVVLVPIHGIVGAAVATGISFVVLNLLRLIEVWYTLGMQPYSRQYWRGAVGITGAVVVLILAKLILLSGIIQSIFAGTIAFFVFAAIMWMLGPTADEWVLIEAVN